MHRPKKIWEFLVTPDMWVQVDPEHYKTVSYSQKQLTAGTKGKMKTEKSPAFTFKVVSVDAAKQETVTSSPIPAGALTLTKRLVPTKTGTRFEEEVVATGPFAGLFSKIFFEKQIKGSLPAQHQAIKTYAEA
jgi:hypothetical protein